MSSDDYVILFSGLVDQVRLCGQSGKDAKMRDSQSVHLGPGGSRSHVNVRKRRIRLQ